MATITFLVDYIELIRRGASRANVSLMTLFEMAALKLPHTTQEIMPFAVLFGTMLAFWRLTRSNELVVARAAGVSVWQFLTPAILVAMLVGVIAVTVYNPIASSMEASYEMLNNRDLRQSGDEMAISNAGLWLRQEAEDGGQVILHGERTTAANLTLRQVSLFFFSNSAADVRDSRIEARSAQLKDGYWRIEGGMRYRAGNPPEPVGELRLPTRLTTAKIEESLASPDTMSFWDLPGFINLLEESGFAAQRHRLHFNVLLARPFLFCAMVLVAATFSLRMQRRGGATTMIVGGVLAGFILYFVSDIVFALGLSDKLPVLLAAWTPTGISLIFGVSMLLHLRRMDDTSRDLAPAIQDCLTLDPGPHRLPLTARRMTGSPRPATCDEVHGIARGALLLAAMTAVLSALIGRCALKAADLLHRRDEDRNAPIVFQADEVQNDDQLGVTVARGHVEISQNHQVLLADTVTYNQRTDTVTASGHVSLLTPNGEVVFGDFMELRDSMNNGFATTVRMLMSDRSRLAANTARRVNGNRLELRRGVYSPCDLCKSDPTAPPAWQLKAREINDDKATKLVEFYDATMEVDGIPVLYTPYISTPDPSVKRASGFLMPSFGNGNNTGFHFAIPYYWVLDTDKDLTIAPRFNATAGARARRPSTAQRFGNGSLDMDQQHQLQQRRRRGLAPGTGDQVRGHINANGVWDIDETYRTGFDIQRVSDQTYLLRFNYPVPLLNTMVSRAYLEGFDPRGATDVNTYLFQPLQPGHRRL